MRTDEQSELQPAIDAEWRSGRQLRVQFSVGLCRLSLLTLPVDH